MIDSILTSIKKLLNISEEDSSFDIDLIIHINSVFSILDQLGVGPDGGFSIEDNTAIWSDYTTDIYQLADIKSYVFLKVKLMFDPPTNSSILQSIERSITELEWRLNVAIENKSDE